MTIPRDLPSCLPPPTSVERYIAVPLSATEQYLISSSGQAYLTEQLPPLMPPPTTSASVMVHSSETGEGSETEDEELQEEEDRQKLLMDARVQVRMARQDLQDHETTC